MSLEALQTQSTHTAVRRAATHKPTGLIRLLLDKLARAAHPVQNTLLIEERLAIGPKKTLMVVNCHGRRFLLATAGDMIAPLIEIQLIDEKSHGETRASQRRRKAGGE